MQLNLAICDDEPNQRQYLASLVSAWAETRSTPTQIHCYESAEHFLFSRETEDEKYLLDILLLDIQMGGQDGVALAKELRKTDERLAIIFITGLPDYVQDGYDVDAMHYLMKPVDEEKLAAVLDKAAARAAKNEPVLLLPADGDITRVLVKDIFYIESFAHYVEITTASQTFTVKMPIYKLEQQLGAGFVRTHRSYIVNLRHIARITKTDVILENGKAIPLSRRLYGEVNKAFIAYFKGAV